MTDLTTEELKALLKHQGELISRFVPDESFSRYHQHQIDMKRALEATLRELESVKAERDWVPIEDIPAEWKDGRLLDVIVDVGIDGNYRLPNCKFIGSKWFQRSNERFDSYRPVVEISDKFGTTKITHAMLPPAPPNQPEGNT